MITPSQYTRLYETWHKNLRDEAVRIARSSDTRSWLMKNIGSAPDSEVVRRAVECIADLTGDECLRKKAGLRLPRVCQKPYPYREPNPNTYTKAIDCGEPMLECPDCKCRIIYNAFTYAVGSRGFSFCPYCGKDRRKNNEPITN